MIYAIFALLVIILDQGVKFWVGGAIDYLTGSIEVVPGVLSLVNIHNEGAAFSFLAGANATLIFIGLAIGVALLVIILLATNAIKGPLARLSLVFVMAGGLGNCIDRILYGYVQDMFRFDFINFAIFNVADIFITLFCIIFILCVLFGHSVDDDEDDEDYDYDDEDEEEYEEEEEEEEVRPSKKRGFKAGKKSKSRDYDDDDEEEDDEPLVAVSKKPAVERPEKPTRKERQQKYEDDYAQFKAARAARAQSAPVSQEPTRRVATVDPSNPFAEWETSRPAPKKPAQAPVASKPAAPKAPAAPVAKAPAAKAPAASKPAAPKAPAAKAPVAPRPAAPAPAPVQKPAPAVKPAAEETEFNLDDILAEFR